MISKHLEGDYLMPLTALKNEHPHLYQQHIKKYKGREALVVRTIPLLNCKWNDVVFFLPIHPIKIKRALKELGVNWEANDWFELTLEDLNDFETKGVIYQNQTRKKGDFAISKEDVHLLNEEELAKHTEIPEYTVEYFRRYQRKEEKRLFPFHGVAHVLYQGKVEISQLKRINLLEEKFTNN